MSSLDLNRSGHDARMHRKIFLFQENWSLSSAFGDDDDTTMTHTKKMVDETWGDLFWEWPYSKNRGPKYLKMPFGTLCMKWSRRRRFCVENAK